MTFAQLIFHALNFMLPALAMALCMPLAGRWVMGPCAMGGGRRAAWHAVLGVLVLGTGLVLQGQDGTMLTYAALVLSAATLEWLLHRGWSVR
jgi:hypothetical protein